MNDDERRDSDNIMKAICPVCKVKRQGTIDRHRALRQHLKRSLKSPKHRIWVSVNYEKHFKHGGDKRQHVVVTPEYVAEAVRSTFGTHWGERITIN